MQWGQLGIDWARLGCEKILTCKTEDVADLRPQGAGNLFDRTDDEDAERWYVGRHLSKT